MSGAVWSVEEHVPMTEKERGSLPHWSRWGSDGYPVTKVRSRWSVDGGGISKRFKTKREAYARWEAYIDTLIARAGVDAHLRATRGEG